MTVRKSNKAPLGNTLAKPLSQAEDYIASLYAEQKNKGLYYHSFEYCRHFAQLVKEAAEDLQLDEKAANTATLAAWFYVVGMLFDYQNFRHESHRLLKDYLLALDVDPMDIPGENIFSTQEPSDISQHNITDLLKDVQIILRAGFVYPFHETLYQAELSEKLNIKISTSELESSFLSEMMANPFTTSWAVKNYGQAMNQTLIDQLDFAQSAKISSSPLKEIKKRKPNNRSNIAVYNFFRIGFRNHMALSSMADNRSHIMISVNSIMMGIMISFVSYQNLASTNPTLLFPVVVFIITSMTSLIFAILAAKPRVWKSETENDSPEVTITHMASYSNFTKLNLEAYETKLETVLQDPQLMRTSLKKDLYFLGKVLELKNRYLSFSYNIFMFGFVASMLLFLSISIWT